MAKVVLGMAIPHSGMLGKPPETWLEDGERDRRNPGLVFDNRTWTFPELAKARRAEGFERLLTLEERRARADRCAAAMDRMREIYERARPDLVVIIGKDQKEIFIETNPSLAIYTGAAIENGPPQRSIFAPDAPVTYQGHPELALHLTKTLMADGFDLTELIVWPPNAWMQNRPIVPHAFGFIYHQLMRDQVPPNVPILMNTFYAPTQPSVGRSIAFGRALYKAIQDWDSDKTVAVIASGGLSHFVCDEDLDRRFIECFRNYDFDALARIDERSYQSGNSEAKLFIPVLAAVQPQGYAMELVDYVPCYRTEAGTGEGMAFMSWSA